MIDVNSLIQKRNIEGLMESLESIKDELSIATLPLKRSFDKKGREKKAVVARINELTLEVESMLKLISEKKDVESMKLFTKRAREIMEEKDELSKKLSELKAQK